jgi:hypothetical protein
MKAVKLTGWRTWKTPVGRRLANAGGYPGLESSRGRGTFKLFTQYFRKKTMIVMFIGELGKFLSSSDPHAEALFWQSFWLTIWKYIWHIYSDILSVFWFFWHILWHPTRHSIWHLFWQFLWHSWCSFWHSIWHSLWNLAEARQCPLSSWRSQLRRWRRRRRRRRQKQLW